jgi:hypothetical protein
MSNLHRGHAIDASYQVSVPLAKRFQKRRFKKKSAEQISTKLARDVHWIVLYQICVFGADLKSNMAARVHNMFSLADILKIFLSET